MYLRIHIWIHYVRCSFPPINILYLKLIITPPLPQNKWRILMLIPCMVITHLQLPRKNLSHTSSYFYNEQQVLCQGWIIRNMIEPLGNFVWLGYNRYWHAQIKYHWSDVSWSMKKLWWWLQYGSSIWQAFRWTPTWHRYM